MYHISVVNWCCLSGVSCDGRRGSEFILFLRESDGSDFYFFRVHYSCMSIPGLVVAVAVPQYQCINHRSRCVFGCDDNGSRWDNLYHNLILSGLNIISRESYLSLH